MSWRHPSDTTLGRWSSGSRSRRVARHAEHCPMCLERLEQITELEPTLRSQLEADLAPQPTLERKLWDRLESRLAEREAVSVFTELLDVGPETSRLLLTGAADDAAPVDDGGDDD